MPSAQLQGPLERAKFVTPGKSNVAEASRAKLAIVHTKTANMLLRNQYGGSEKLPYYQTFRALRPLRRS